MWATEPKYPPLQSGPQTRQFTLTEHGNCPQEALDEVTNPVKPRPAITEKIRRVFRNPSENVAYLKSLQFAQDIIVEYFSNYSRRDIDPNIHKKQEK